MNQPVPLLELVRSRAESSPNHIWLIDSERSVTYSEAHKEVATRSSYLRKIGIDSGETVLTMLPNSIESVLSWLAITSLGAIDVPINTSYKGQMLTHIVKDSAADCLITTSKFHQQIIDSDAKITEGLTSIILVGSEIKEPSIGKTFYLDYTMEAEEESKLPEVQLHDVSCILYTSGTTGPAKGVLVPWGHLYATATGCIPLEGLGEKDHWYSPFPMFHMSGRLSVYASAIIGSSVIIREYFKTDEFWKDIDLYKITTSLLIGSTPVFLWNQEPSEDDSDHTLVNVLMAPVPENPDAYKSRFGIKISTVFNMTEISCPVMSHWQLGPPGSCGKIRDGYEVRIVDENDYEVPLNDVGEIIVRSSKPWTLNSGYWKAPEATAKAWRNGWFHTGDGGKIDDEGYIYFVDRIIDTIRRRGENISSMALEAMANESPFVDETAAIGVPADVGEEDVMLYVVSSDNLENFPYPDFWEDLEKRLPRFMMPRYVLLVNSLPVTPTEKVRKVKLRENANIDLAWDAVEAGLKKS